MTKYQQDRIRAHVTQCEAAVRARVCPVTARAFERHGPKAVIDEEKRTRLIEVYRLFEVLAQKQAA